MSSSIKGFVVVLASFATIVDAAIVQFDVACVFDADVIVNDGSGTFDPTQQSIDLGVIPSGNFALLTQSVAIVSAVAPETPNGLPDDGFFAANAFHPEVALAYDNADDGNNARRLTGVASFSFPVPLDTYTAIHLFFTSGDGDGLIDVSLDYDDGGSVATSATVPDWFDDPVETSALYRLMDGGDRIQPGSGPGVLFDFEDSNDTAIHGVRVDPDPVRPLSGITIRRTDTSGVLCFFGATGETATTAIGIDLYESIDAATILLPTNVVAMNITSAHDQIPAGQPELFYQADDGTGSPSVIYIVETVAGIQVSF